MTVLSFQPSPRAVARAQVVAFGVAAVIIVSSFILVVSAAAAGWLGYPGWIGPLAVNSAAMTLLALIVVDDRRTARRAERKATAQAVPDDISSIATAAGVLHDSHPDAPIACPEHGFHFEGRNRAAMRPCGHSTWDPCFSIPCAGCNAGTRVARFPRTSPRGA